MSHNVRSATIRKGGRDAGLTPTEQHRKDILMRQFVNGDGPRGSSEAYREGWDRVFGGSLRVETDSTLPPGTAELRNQDGSVAVRVVNIGMGARRAK